jgi:hypothetical protein
MYSGMGDEDGIDGWEGECEVSFSGAFCESYIVERDERCRSWFCISCLMRESKTALWGCEVECGGDGAAAQLI